MSRPPSDAKRFLTNLDAKKVVMEANQDNCGASLVRHRAYLPEVGLNLETPYYSGTVLWWLVSTPALELLAGRLVKDEADAKQIARLHEDKIRSAMTKRLQERGPSSLGGKARELSEVH